MSLAVVVVHPDLLGTYGDGGNGMVLVQRARWRGIDAELVEAASGAPLPEGDLYCLGGGEDVAQRASAERLRSDDTLLRAVDRGAPVLAVCAGYQILGRTFPSADGRPVRGAGLLDVATSKGPGRRAVGEVLAEPADAALGLPVLTGFENHAGLTARGPGVAPLGRLSAGVGNGDGTDGAISGRVVGTYLHGPVLARNPALADLLLSWAVGSPLDALDDAEEDALREERLAEMRARRSPRGRVARYLRGSP
ncbi:MAG: glutamine amidotransferase [Actinomycetota bacterium]|nr:glutamine amidotransferase [Actinomycetota bacterium]